jgi:simple sugar transport system permease protein
MTTEDPRENPGRAAEPAGEQTPPTQAPQTPETQTPQTPEPQTPEAQTPPTPEPQTPQTGAAEPTPADLKPPTPQAAAVESHVTESHVTESHVAESPDAETSDWGRIARNLFTAESTPMVTLLAIVLALIVGAILIIISDPVAMRELGYFFSRPSDFFHTAWHDISRGYTDLFKGSIFNPAFVHGTPSQFFGPITSTLEDATPLIFGGLAVTVAFRAGMFNIGGQGMTISGAIGAAYVAFAWTGLPGALQLIVAIVGGIFGGVLLGGLVGWLKAKRGAHEVVVTIMLNYVMFFFISNYLLTTSAFHDPAKGSQAISKPAAPNAILPHLFGPSLNTDFGLVIALAATVLVAWFFKRSKLGFEIRAVGLNPAAARTNGISVARVQIWAMVISGGLMGLIGMSQVLGLNNPSNNALSPNIDAGLGFNAITVALLGRTKPWGVVWAALLYGAFQAGAATMQANDGISTDIISVIEALIVIFVSAPQLIKEIFRLRSRGVATAGAAA